MADKISSCFRCLCCRLKQRVRLQSDTWYAISRCPCCRQKYKPGSTRELNYLNTSGDHKNTPVFFEKHPPEPRKTIFPYRKTHLTLSLWLSWHVTQTILQPHLYCFTPSFLLFYNKKHRSATRKTRCFPLAERCNSLICRHIHKTLQKQRRNRRGIRRRKISPEF